MPQLPELSDEDIAKVERLKGSITAKAVSPEMYFQAKFGYFYGWEGLKALHSNEITLEDAEELLAATEMVWHEYAYMTALGVFYGSKDGKSFNTGAKRFTNRINVET